MNRQVVKNPAYYLTKPFSLNFLRNLSGQNFIFPFYHLVSDNNPAHVKHLYPVVPVGQFLSDLDFLMKYYRPARIKDVLDFIKNGKKSSEPFFFLSFDDGMHECYDIVYPILKQKGIQAAFFINPAFVNNRELFYKHKISLVIEQVINTNEPVPAGFTELLKLTQPDNSRLIEYISQLNHNQVDIIDKAGEIIDLDFNTWLQDNKPFMTLEQVRELQDNGHIIGSHSFDHPDFRKITDEEKQDQVLKSFEFIDKNLKPEVYAFAFPFYDMDVPESFFRFLYEDIKVDVSFGTSGIKMDSLPSHIQRIPMEEKNKNGRRIIRTEYAYFWVKSFFGKNTVKRI